MSPFAKPIGYLPIHVEDSVQETTVIASLNNVVKQYPGVLALDQVSFEIYAGEVRALLGKNGAGKSTLIRMLTGAEAPDSGEVLIAGEKLLGQGTQRTRFASSLGVRSVYQELSLVPHMNVAENVFLGGWPLRRGAINQSKMIEATELALERLGIELDPFMLVSELSPAQCQLTEIARTLIGKPRLVILDEPTSSLAAHEVELVARAVRKISAEGIAVVYVSHRMNEIRSLAKTATIMRDGRVVENVQVENVDTQEIVRLMLGHTALDEQRVMEARSGGPVVLSVNNLKVPPKLSDITFDLREGEVLGIAGLLGAGRTELLRAICGFDPIASGKISVCGVAERKPTYKKMLRLGFALTPENRKQDGIVPLLGVDENTVITDTKKVSQYGLLSWERIGMATRDIVQRMQIKVSRTRTPIGTLSGGNQQKVVIGRWVYAGSKILLLDEPTRGVDVEAKVQIYSIIRKLAAEGKSVIFISSEIEELPQVCDRVLVLQNGRITKEFRAPDINADVLMSSTLSGH